MLTHETPDTMAPPRRSMLADAARTLHPGYFALVMATGIVSTAMHDVGVDALSVALLVIGLASFAVLLVLITWRAVAFRDELRRDLSNPNVAFAFFTFVAASNVLGSRLGLDGHETATIALLLLSFPVWAALSYGLPIYFILGPRNGTVLRNVNGTWFIWVVGSQSIAVSVAVIEPAFPDYARELALTGFLMWSVGFVLYLIVAVLVLVRLLNFPVEPADLTPPYWVTMGATAITVLAGARLIAMDAASPVMEAAEPALTGLTVTLWAYGTWLIPMLLAFGYWRHRMQRVAMNYVPTMWSIVFPVGMYGVASSALGDAADLPIVYDIGQYEAWIALVTWATFFVAMLISLTGGIRRRRQLTHPVREITTSQRDSRA